MKIAFYTLGCKVNQYESQAMETILTGRGHTLVPFESEAEIYLVRLDPSRTDKPTFIRAADFDYTHAKRVKKEELTTPYVPKSYFKHGDFTTLMPSQYEGADVLQELPTIRSTGNKIRLPLAVAMSYGVDVPLTIAGYTISPLVHLFLMPFEE